VDQSGAGYRQPDTAFANVSSSAWDEFAVRKNCKKKNQNLSPRVPENHPS
jgi:hypothetical protein